MPTKVAESPSTLKPATSAPEGQPHVVILSSAKAAQLIQVPPRPSGSIWFAYGLGPGSSILDVTFNGQSYSSVPPSQYQLRGVTTTLELSLTVLDGSAKLAWINS